MPGYVNKGDASGLLGVSRPTLNRRIAEGVIPVEYIGGMAVIPVDEVARIAEEGRERQRSKGAGAKPRKGHPRRPSR